MSKRSDHWPTVRAAHLATHPVCEACGVADHLEVHHILPFHVDPSKELDQDNLITLCEKPGHDCHFTWGHYHDWYKYNPDVIDDAEWYRRSAERAP